MLQTEAIVQLPKMQGTVHSANGKAHMKNVLQTEVTVQLPKMQGTVHSANGQAHIKNMQQIEVIVQLPKKNAGDCALLTFMHFTEEEECKQNLASH